MIYKVSCAIFDVFISFLTLIWFRHSFSELIGKFCLQRVNIIPGFVDRTVLSTCFSTLERHWVSWYLLISLSVDESSYTVAKAHVRHARFLLAFNSFEYLNEHIFKSLSLKDLWIHRRKSYTEADVERSLAFQNDFNHHQFCSLANWKEWRWVASNNIIIL